MQETASSDNQGWGTKTRAHLGIQKDEAVELAMTVSASFRTLVLILVEPHVPREKPCTTRAMPQGADSQTGKTATDKNVTLEVRSACMFDAYRFVTFFGTRGLTFS
jgi:hypothetical protein